jgi:serine/threonine protein phosphatase PrpC
MSSVDSERTKAEIKPGDHIILMSDGVSDESEDAPWLLLLLGETPDKNLNVYAERILAEAKKNRITSDDMSVILIRISEI